MQKTLLIIVLATLCLNFTLKAQQPIPQKPKSAITKADTTKSQKDSIDLNEVQIIGYGQTTRRLSTGSISSISAKQIEQQPVTNVLSVLSGRMPGVFVQTTNGLPGGNINIQIRGKGSIAAGTDPLYIIDGIPFQSSLIGATSVLATSTLQGAVNPLNSINPADIESISVLKDADATSIYGSRGSNGVILITTKKAGQSKASVAIHQGYSSASSLPKMLEIDDYLTIRKEAFANNNTTPTATNAQDLLLWDQNQNTNWGEFLFGNTASYTDVQASLSGGNQHTSISAAANFHRENTILSDKANYQRGGLQATIDHRSKDQRLHIQLSNSVLLDDNSSPNVQNAVNAMLLSPNYPLYTEGGDYYWRSTTNPLAEMNATTSAKTDNLSGNLTLDYRVIKNLIFKISTGYNKININQQQLYPTVALQPGSVNYAQYARNSSQNFITEPQLLYDVQKRNSRINILLGGTYQDRLSEGSFFKASNFSNEQLLANISSAATIDTRTNSYTYYRYASAFARVNYQLADRYILNATIRRDGSSRFGAGNRFGNFGSLGMAWIFSQESWLANAVPALSYGKLRASYGTVGNDQIPDYQFLSTYNSSGLNYQGQGTLKPARIDNTEFHWETTRKLDLALELGWFNNRILLNTTYYRSRSRDQLVQYTLPRITGFASYQANLPAVVQNTGLELELSTHNIRTDSFSWRTAFNLTLPENKLISFQNFESSSYSRSLKLGYDITRTYGYRFLGVNPETGVASYADESGVASATPFFYHTLGRQTPDFYGGLGNTLSYKNLSLDLFFQFSRQQAMGGLRGTPGQLINNFAVMASRWQKPGDITDVPRANLIIDSFYTGSSVNYHEVPYLRLKNVSLSYTLPQSIANSIKSSSAIFFLRGQNLLTFWDNQIPLADPESGAFSLTQRNVPPVTTFIAGFQLNF